MRVNFELCIVQSLRFKVLSACLQLIYIILFISNCAKITAPTPALPHRRRELKYTFTASLSRLGKDLDRGERTI
jgi:hypothetical protein